MLSLCSLHGIAQTQVSEYLATEGVSRSIVFCRHLSRSMKLMMKGAACIGRVIQGVAPGDLLPASSTWSSTSGSGGSMINICSSSLLSQFSQIRRDRDTYVTKDKGMAG